MTNWLSVVVAFSKYSKYSSQNWDTQANASSAFSPFFKQWISSTFPSLDCPQALNDFWISSGEILFQNLFSLRILIECEHYLFFSSKNCEKLRTLIECEH